MGIDGWKHPVTTLAFTEPAHWIQKYTDWVDGLKELESCRCDNNQVVSQENNVTKLKKELRPSKKN